MKQTGEKCDMLFVLQPLLDILEYMEGIKEMQAVPFSTILQYIQSSLYCPLLVRHYDLGFPSYCSEEGMKKLKVSLFGILESRDKCKRNHTLAGTCA